jgi:hypothetical protein
MSVSDAKTLRRNRIQLLLIFGLFLIPPVGAWMAWKYVGEHGVGATTNTGVLVSPARPLDTAGLEWGGEGEPRQAVLQGRWTYVIFAPGGCDERCQQQLYLTRQIRLAMSKDVRRVQRLLVLNDMPSAALMTQLESDHVDLEWAVRGTTETGFAEHFSGETFDSSGAQYFLVDPLGNLMMYYDLSSPTKGMMKDLQKLLKTSQIG